MCNGLGLRKQLCLLSLDFLENYIRENNGEYGLFEDAEKNLISLNCNNAKIDSDSDLDTDSDND